jgi:hypothetical protein
MGDDRPIRYIDPDGTVVYRASGLGACDGVLLGLGRGRKPNAVPEWLQEVYDEGHRMESTILAQLQEQEAFAGYQFDSQTEWELEVGEINDRRVIVRGHTDGWDVTERTFAEAKKFRPSTWPKFLSKGVECSPLYPWQASVYMHAAIQQGFQDVNMVFVGGEYIPEVLDDDGNVTERERINSVHPFMLSTPPIPLKAIRKRIARWENMIDDGLDVTDLREQCKPSMYPCPMFGKGCPSETEKDEPLLLTGDYAIAGELIATALATQASIAKTANQMLAAVKSKKKELEADLHAFRQQLVDDGVVTELPPKMSAGGFTLTHVTGEVPERVAKGYELDYFKVTPPKKETTTP